jgi:hypothetical protein
MTLSAAALWLHDPARFQSGSVSGLRATLVQERGPAQELDDFLVELPPGGCYLTNASYRALKAAGLDRRGDLRCDDYLGTRVASLIDEVGLQDAQRDVKARFLADVFGEVMRLAHDHLEIPMHPAGRTLAVAIRHAYLRDRQPPASQEVREALQLAFQRATYSAMTEGRRSGRRVVMRQHRQSYAENLLSVDVPFGEWCEVLPPSDEAKRVVWARDLLEERPLLVHAKVHFHGPHAHALAQMVNIGSGAQPVATEWGRAVNNRSWLAGPEFVALSTMADVRIDRVLAADQYVEGPWTAFDASASPVGPPAGAPILCGPLRLHGPAQLTRATGLLAESLWQSLIAVRADAGDAIATWIAAHDRAACLRAAYRIVLERVPGVSVAGYSRGRLWIHVADDGNGSESVYRRVAEIAAMTHLVPPVMPAPPAASERLVIANGIVGAIQERPDPGLMMAARVILGATEPMAGAA